MDTVTRILESAERLAQTRGFGGFSYADIAQDLDLRKASIHHHFPTKADLGRELIARYRAGFLAALARIDASGSPPTRLRRYVRLYADVLRAGRMCLCGMLAAEVDTLPGTVTEALRSFFVENEAWVARLLSEGRRGGTLRFSGAARDNARTIVATLEGAMLVARSFGDPTRFDAAARNLLTELVVKRA